LKSQGLVLGKTYFLNALNSWVIPVRKAMRNQHNQLTGVMIAGIKPKDLLPKLNELSNKPTTTPYQAMLVHDNSFNYAYISGVSNTNQVKDLINNPISTETVQQHNQSMLEQHGLSMSDIKNSINSIEYFAPSIYGDIKFYSMVYLPDYQLWSLTFLPRSHLIEQLKTTVIQYTLAFIIVFTIIFFLFRYINKFELASRQQLIKQVNHDFLTGLNNRLFLQHIEPEWTHAKAQPFSVIFMDLDNFKNINDSYGHNYGDLILKQVASRLLSLFTENALVCRQGGDEFIILCKKADQKSLDKIATRVLEAIAQPFVIEHYQFTIGASIGICRYPEDGDSFDNLFSAADDWPVQIY